MPQFSPAPSKAAVSGKDDAEKAGALSRLPVGASVYPSRHYEEISHIVEAEIEANIAGRTESERVAVRSLSSVSALEFGDDVAVGRLVADCALSGQHEEALAWVHLSAGRGDDVAACILGACEVSTAERREDAIAGLARWLSVAIKDPAGAQASVPLPPEEFDSGEIMQALVLSQSMTRKPV